MAIYQGDSPLDDIKIGNNSIFEIYQGTKKVYPGNLDITVTFNLNTAGLVTINGYTPKVNVDKTQYIFTIPTKTNYTANISADHYIGQSIKETTDYVNTIHNIELVWEIKYDKYTILFPTNGIKVLFDGEEKGVITNNKLEVLIDDRIAKNSYNVTFEGHKDNTYNTTLLKLNDILSNIDPRGGNILLLYNNINNKYLEYVYKFPKGTVSKNNIYDAKLEGIENILEATYNIVPTYGSYNNNQFIFPNNTSEEIKTGEVICTFHTIQNGNDVFIPISQPIKQLAGSKVYTDWELNLSTNKISVAAKGETITVNTNVAKRYWTWNGIGNKTEETATPTLSITGDATLNGNQIIFTNNTSISSRSATLKASYAGLIKEIVITQQAGSKVYSTWSNWNVLVSANSQTIPASGGSVNLTTSANRTRTWTWNGIGTVTTDTETGIPTLSGTSAGFTLSNKTVTANNNESPSIRSINIVATYQSVTKSITISQSAGVKNYGAWSKWTINYNTSGNSIGATGGSQTFTIINAIRTRSYTWNGIGTSYTEQGTGIPTIRKQSGDATVTINGTTATISYGNNTSTNARSSIVRATMDTEYIESTFSQVAGAKQYSDWTPWTINLSADITTIGARGGNSIITTASTRYRTWTWNGVANSGGTESITGSPSLSKVSGNGSFANNTVSYGNNESTNSKSTTIRATIDGNITKDIIITQTAGTKTYGSYSAWNINISASLVVVPAKGGTSVITSSATRTRSWQWNGIGSSYTETNTGNVTLSKISGIGNLNNNNLTYNNNESYTIIETIIKAQIDNDYKQITIKQNSGEKIYTVWSNIIFTINGSTGNATSNVVATGGQVELNGSAIKRRTFQWNGTGTTYPEAISYQITSWSSDTANTLVYADNKVYAHFDNNQSLNTRQAKFYAYIAQENVTSTNYFILTQTAGSFVVTKTLGVIEPYYKGFINYRNRVDYHNSLKAEDTIYNIYIPSAGLATIIPSRLSLNKYGKWNNIGTEIIQIKYAEFKGYLNSNDVVPDETGYYIEYDSISSKEDISGAIVDTTGNLRITTHGSVMYSYSFKVWFVFMDSVNTRKKIRHTVSVERKLGTNINILDIRQGSTFHEIRIKVSNYIYQNNNVVNILTSQDNSDYLGNIYITTLNNSDTEIVANASGSAYAVYTYYATFRSDDHFLVYNHYDEPISSQYKGYNHVLDI